MTPRSSIVFVASRRTHTAACGAENALWTMASAIERRTPFTGMRSSFGPVDQDSMSLPTKREVVVGPLGAGTTCGCGCRDRGAAQGPLDVVTSDQSIATRSGDRREVNAVLLRVETNGRGASRCQ